MKEQSSNTEATAFTVEQRGIDLVPENERHGSPRDLIWFWAGTNMSVFAVVYGPVLIAMGLSLAEATIAIIVGNVVSYAVLGLTSLQGPKVGTSTMVISRAAFGPNAARGYAFLNWISIVGFEAIGLALMVAAAKSVFAYFDIEIGMPGTIALLICLALLQLLLPRLGYQALMLVKKYFTAVFFIAFGAISIYILPNADYSSLAGGGGSAALFAGIMLMLASGGFSWAGTGSDYTRYLPKNTSSRRIWWAVVIGNCIPIIALQILGAAVASVTPLAEDPISGIPSALPDVFFVPYVVIAILTLLSINASSMYSSGLNLQTLGLKVRRTRAVFFDLIVGGTIAFFAVLAPTFEDALGVFLSLFGLWVAPWAGVYLCDWIARRGKYDAESLFPTPTNKGMYWGNGGVRWQAVVAQVGGMIFGGLWAEVEGVFTGPLMQASGGVNLSIPIGFIMGFLIYLLLAKKAPEPELPGRGQVR